MNFHKKHKDNVLKGYLPYILRKAKEIKEEKKVVRLHTVDYNGIDYWSSVILNHPATLESMAMDPDAKKELIDDLDRFMSRKDYYRYQVLAFHVNHITSSCTKNVYILVIVFIFYP